MTSGRRASPRWVRRVLVLAAMLAAAVVGSTGTATAEGPPRLLLADQGGPDLVRKIAAEAADVGFAVVRAGGETAVEHDDVVARVVVLSEDRVEVRIGTEGPSDARVLTAPPGEAQVFALLVVEDVRARLVDLRLWIPPGAPSASSGAPEAPPPLRPPPSAPVLARVAAPNRPVASPAVPATPEAQPWRVWLGGGPVGILPAGGLGPTVQGLLGASLEPSPRWGIGAVAILPLLGNVVRGPEGEAEVRATIVAGQVHFIPWRWGGWSAGLGAGGGPLVLAMRADAPAPYVGREVTNVTGVYFLEARGARTVGDWFRIQALLLGGISGPRPVVAFDDREAAAWGRLFGAVALRADLGFTPGSGTRNP